MTHVTREREPFPPRWAFLVLALVIIAGLGWTVYNQVAATTDKNTAQANSQTLAHDIQTICETDGKLLIGDRDICPKADSVLANPTEAIAGPKGDPGKDGLNGVNGNDGLNGKDGLPGQDGEDGKPGVDGKDGLPGANGFNGTDGKDGLPGINGLNGADGTDGADGEAGTDGQTPTSFTFTDKTGTTYRCTPNPPGSTTYTCIAEGVKP